MPGESPLQYWRVPISVGSAKQLIAKRTGVSGDCVFISATHTHTVPTCTGVSKSDPDKDYQRFLALRIADGVQCAVNNFAPLGSGEVLGELKAKFLTADGASDGVNNPRYDHYMFF